MTDNVSKAEELKEEIALRLSKGEKTNFYLSYEQYALDIEEGRVRRFDFCEGMYLFFEKETCDKLYYFLKKEGTLKEIPLALRPIVVEDVFMANREYFPKTIDWEKIGFLPYLQRKRLYLSLKNRKEEERAPRFATQGMIEDIIYLMIESFEPHTSALPSKNELEEDIENKKVIVIINEDRVVGFLRFGREKQSSVLWQIAVNSKEQGKNIGASLVRDWMYVEREVIKKYVLWVRVDNTIALALYEKLGFLPDGRIAPVMIQQPREEYK